ncbi:enoyl-CoA hydratase-related protein [Bradyrhizobium erythrophlei]|uniref:Enoyl-CoA hydratase/carnithine racemase n=1 Tax=Bradyrhizobium erythrophlei TaxID=1437360 RepID=A0A1H4WH00_9BRAD|nr:enoyl-CoA hydratase-related protein [Bradyrhizobium erythrophlei]SEC92577.1 Enoyl-CoA hydratase/carnithine racemase [Bradyrhizobium erythrophlei]
MAGRVVVGQQGAVRTIAVLHAEGINARADDLCLAMTMAIESAQRDPAISSIVVAGGFDGFAAGREAAEHRAVGGAGSEGFPLQGVTGLLHTLASNAKPIIAAVEGAAAGIGTAIVFYCDQVIAATSTTFTSPLESHDLVPDGAISLLIPRRLAQYRAFAMLVPGRSMRAERAYDAGLIDMIVPPGHAAIEAERMAHQLCRLPAEDDRRGIASEGTAGRSR